MLETHLLNLIFSKDLKKSFYQHPFLDIYAVLALENGFGGECDDWFV